MSNNEVERLKRLREQQISARDPRHADRKRHQVTSQRPRATFSFAEEMKHLGAKVTWMVWGAVIGLFVGLAFSAVLWVTLKISWGEYITLGTILFCGLLGRIFGGIKDSGREDWRS